MANLGNDPIFLLRQIFDAIEYGWLTDLIRLLDGVCSSKEERHDFLSVRVEGGTPLIRASRMGKINIVRFLVLECNLSVEEEGKIVEDTEVIDCVTPLWAASIGGHIDVVRFLVDMGADVNHATASSSTPLRAACFVGDEEVFDFLVDHGADVNKCKHDGSTCLMVACFHGHSALVNKLLEHKAEKRPICQEGWTMLYCAAASGNVTLMKELIEEGEDVNSSFPNGVTSLMRACEDGKEEVVELLLKHGADYAKSTDQGYTALHFCAQHGRLSCLVKLLDHGADINALAKNGDTVLKKACINGRPDVVEELLKRKARLDLVDKSGNTALHLCCTSRRLGCLKLLIEYGADVNAQNNEGDTCLMQACQNSDTTVVQYLVGQGGSIEIVNNKGETPLMKAFSANSSTDPVIISLLLLKGAVTNHSGGLSCPRSGGAARCTASPLEIGHLSSVDFNVNTKDNNGETVLHKCVSSRQQSARALQFLLMSGADVNVEDSEGKTPIAHAWDRLNREAVAYLLKNDAKFDVYSVCSDTDNTIFHECARKNDLSSLKTLVPYADKGLNVRNKDGDTPCRLAALNGFEELVEYFISLDCCDKEDKLECLELLGAVLLGKPNEDAWSVHRSVRIWQRILRMRSSSGVEQTQAAVHDVEASDTDESYYPKICVNIPSLESLDDFEVNPVDVVCYAIKVCVKILTPAHSRLPALLGEISDSFVRLDSMSHGLQVWSYVLDLYQKRLEPGHEETLNTFRCFAEAFRYVLTKEDKVDTDILRSVMRRALKELEGCRSEKLVNCVLHFIATFTHSNCSPEDHRSFLVMVRDFIKMDCRTSKGFTVLHLASSTIPESICAREHHFRFPNVEVIKLLLQAGANIDAVDNNKNTVLHVALTQGYSDPKVLEFLLKEGAHLDAVNKDGKAALELVRSFKVRTILASQHGFVYPLQCLAARSIVKNKLDYEHCLPRSITSFIELH